MDEIVPDLDSWKLVIPEEQRVDILREMHDDPHAAHPGIEKTYKKVAQFYYWPSIYRDTLNYVKICGLCQQCKIDQSKQIGLMDSRDVNYPGKTIAVDLIGKLPRSRKRYKYLIIFEDIFTKYIICVPIRKKIANVVKDAIENQLCTIIGTPDTIISDNGKEFINETLRTFLNDNAIKHECTPSYHPQANPVERVNRDIKIMISLFISENHKEWWDKYINKFQFAHNTTVHTATGRTPAFLMFGRELKPPKLSRRKAELETKLDEDETKKCDTKNESYTQRQTRK